MIRSLLRLLGWGQPDLSELAMAKRQHDAAEQELWAMCEGKISASRYSRWQAAYRKRQAEEWMARLQ